MNRCVSTAYFASGHALHNSLHMVTEPEELIQQKERVSAWLAETHDILLFFCSCVAHYKTRVHLVGCWWLWADVGVALRTVSSICCLWLQVAASLQHIVFELHTLVIFCAVGCLLE